MVRREMDDKGKGTRIMQRTEREKLTEHKDDKNIRT